MIWQQYSYSKNQANKSARTLLDNNLALEERLVAIKVLADFRAAHAYPMQSMIGYFRKKAFAIDKNAIVVRRLKRIPSIVSKLKRFHSMQVSTMGDIGGIRVIVKDILSVKKLAKNLLEGRTQNKLVSNKDYLTSPKDSGYRGVHLTYAYQGAKKDYENFKVELQLRSQIQHSWATAVEVVGTFNDENLKAGLGSKKWLNFFKSVSTAFAHLENKESIDSQLKRGIKEDCIALKVFDVLRFFSVAVHAIKEKEGLYLLQLDISAKTIHPRFYQVADSYNAAEDYRRIEQEISEDSTKDVVLVSASSIKELKKAYPNYFADTNLFMQNINEVIK